MAKIAIVRIRGLIGIKREIKDTMEMLGLFRKNYCVIVDDTPCYRGMIRKIKDFVTFGEVDEALIKELQEKKGEKDPKDETKLKKFFRLAPPRGGFERKGIKKPFTIGGALGNRGSEINNLIKKMM